MAHENNPKRLAVNGMLKQAKIAGSKNREIAAVREENPENPGNLGESGRAIETSETEEHRDANPSVPITATASIPTFIPRSKSSGC